MFCCGKKKKKSEEKPVPLPRAVGKAEASKEGDAPNHRTISKAEPVSVTHTDAERSDRTVDGKYERKEPIHEVSVADVSLTDSEGEEDVDEGTADVMEVTLQLGPSKDTLQEVSRKAPERLINLFASPKAIQSSKEDIVKTRRMVFELTRECTNLQQSNEEMAKEISAERQSFELERISLQSTSWGRTQLVDQERQMMKREEQLRERQALLNAKTREKQMTIEHLEQLEARLARDSEFVDRPTPATTATKATTTKMTSTSPSPSSQRSYLKPSPQHPSSDADALLMSGGAVTPFASPQTIRSPRRKKENVPATGGGTGAIDRSREKEKEKDKDEEKEKEKETDSDPQIAKVLHDRPRRMRRVPKGRSTRPVPRSTYFDQFQHRDKDQEEETSRKKETPEEASMRRERVRQARRRAIRRIREKKGILNVVYGRGADISRKTHDENLAHSLSIGTGSYAQDQRFSASTSTSRPSRPSRVSGQSRSGIRRKQWTKETGSLEIVKDVGAGDRMDAHRRDDYDSHGKEGEGREFDDIDDADADFDSMELDAPVLSIRLADSPSPIKPSKKRSQKPDPSFAASSSRVSATEGTGGIHQVSGYAVRSQWREKKIGAMNPLMDAPLPHSHNTRRQHGHQWRSAARKAVEKEKEEQDEYGEEKEEEEKRGKMAAKKPSKGPSLPFSREEESRKRSEKGSYVRSPRGKSTLSNARHRELLRDVVVSLREISSRGVSDEDRRVVEELEDGSGHADISSELDDSMKVDELDEKSVAYDVPVQEIHLDAGKEDVRHIDSIADVMSESGEEGGEITLEEEEETGEDEVAVVSDEDESPKAVTEDGGSEMELNPMDGDGHENHTTQPMEDDPMGEEEGEVHEHAERDTRDAEIVLSDVVVEGAEVDHVKEKTNTKMEEETEEMEEKIDVDEKSEEARYESDVKDEERKDEEVKEEEMKEEEMKEEEMKDEEMKDEEMKDEEVKEEEMKDEEVKEEEVTEEEVKDEEEVGVERVAQVDEEDEEDVFGGEDEYDDILP